MSSSKNFISIEECLELYKKCNSNENGKLVFVDSSWHVAWKAQGKSGRDEFEKLRIPNAKYFDIDDISSKGSYLNPKDLPHMMPTKELFSAAMDAMNITNEDNIIIYGTHGSIAGPRVWYTFRSMGHAPEKVKLMKGSLQEWQKLGGEVDTSPCTIFQSSDLDLDSEKSYKAQDAKNIFDLEGVLDVVNNKEKSDIIVDARPQGRFLGTSPEPRPTVNAGHMPGSLNLPFISLLQDSSELLTFKSEEDLANELKLAGLSESNENVICTCGSGVTACHIALALDECGYDSDKVFIYDGSWGEYGNVDDAPVEQA